MNRKAKSFRKIGLIANADKPAFRAVVQRAARLIAASGRLVRGDAFTVNFAGLKCAGCEDISMLAREVDLIMVFGGDGTMLRAAREVAGSRTPILGINIGGLGFLTAAGAEQVGTVLKKVWHGEFRLESRALIEATGRVGGRPFRHRALNDFVIARGNEPRLIELEVSVNNQPLTRYRADGLIISSPTGSTAYSLAAGGAVISPTAEVFELTPICAHTISNRPLILDLRSTIQVRIIRQRPTATLNGDGQALNDLTAGDVITVRRSKHSIRLMQVAGNSFFDTLRAKLHWRGATV